MRRNNELVPVDKEKAKEWSIDGQSKVTNTAGLEMPLRKADKFSLGGGEPKWLSNSLPWSLTKLHWQPKGHHFYVVGPLLDSLASSTDSPRSHPLKLAG